MNNNLINKKQKYEELAKKIKAKYRSEIKFIEKVIKVIENNGTIKEEDTIETIIFKKYLELENVQLVANYINDLGYRIKTESYKGKRKFIGSDISDIIASNVKVDKNLKEIVQYIHYEHSLAMARKYS